MFGGKTDREWEKYGKDDPYYGVASLEKFHKANLTEETKKEFFKHGYDYIENVLKTIREKIDPGFAVANALDFGCGVGRLVIPLAGIADRVTGLDVSDSMLDEATKNCELRSITNVTLEKSDDSLTILHDQFDFIHSYIVFQHIPVRRGERIFSGLLDRLTEGGVGVVHFTYAKETGIKRAIPLIKKYIPLAKNILNAIKGRSFFAPGMEMNVYNLNRLFILLQKSSITHFHAEYTNHGGELGIILYFQKPKAANT